MAGVALMVPNTVQMVIQFPRYNMKTGKQDTKRNIS